MDNVRLGYDGARLKYSITFEVLRLMSPCRQYRGPGSLPFANGWELCELSERAHAQHHRACARSKSALARCAVRDRQGHWTPSTITEETTIKIRADSPLTYLTYKKSCPN